ncbi:hypothetical protein WR25_10162 [Diploscapter pachys]|uniref:Fungal lipase-type domain-containing protein n=1 Tax=Diploscapter pachys TaxID=2018661 RepID=A0A2A2L6T5_9BILA|nr:hypothetical protein WR25_10162 [Diploscapter pachys]
MTAVKIAQLQWWPPSQMFFVGYGTPRCGNEDFAYYVDKSLADKFRVNWYADPIPTQILHKKEKVFGIEYTGEKKCKLPEDNACLTGNNPSDHHSYYDTKGTMYNDVTCKGNDF